MACCLHRVYFYVNKLGWYVSILRKINAHLRRDRLRRFVSAASAWIAISAPMGPAIISLSPVRLFLPVMILSSSMGTKVGIFFQTAKHFCTFLHFYCHLCTNHDTGDSSSGSRGPQAHGRLPNVVSCVRACARAARARRALCARPSSALRETVCRAHGSVSGRGTLPPPPLIGLDSVRYDSLRVCARPRKIYFYYYYLKMCAVVCVVVCVAVCVVGCVVVCPQTLCGRAFRCVVGCVVGCVAVCVVACVVACVRQQRWR